MPKKVVPGGDSDDDGSDSDSIPSIESEDENGDHEEEDKEEEEYGDQETTYGGRRGAAGNQEARDALGAWKERPEPRTKVDYTESKWPCYDCRWFTGCCIYYPVEDTIILGDLELVIFTVKRMKRRFPDDWQARINIRHQQYGGHTITSLAILEGRPDIAEWLIENGLDIDQRDLKTGLSPLHHTIRQQCLLGTFMTTVLALIEAGAEIDIRDQVTERALCKRASVTAFQFPQLTAGAPFSPAAWGDPTDACVPVWQHRDGEAAPREPRGS